MALLGLNVESAGSLAVENLTATKFVLRTMNGGI